MPAAPRARRLLAIVFVAACAVLYFKQNIASTIPTPGPSDFGNLYTAAKHVLHSESPFLTAEFIYPPLLACVLAPIGWFDYYTARWIWYVLAHLCFLAAGFLWWRRLGRGWIAGSAIMLVWSAGWVAHDGFATGQPDALLLLLIVVPCLGSGWISGAAAGVGFAVKLIPGVLGALTPLERNWRGLLAFLAAAGLLMTIPWAIVAGLRGPSRPASTDYIFGTPCTLSWSFPSVALRILEPPGPDGKLPNDWLVGWDLPRLHLSPRQKVVSLSVAAVVLGAGLTLLLFKTRGRITPEQIPIAGTALVALALAASPIAWWHYQVFQYPGITLLFTHAIRARDWRRLAMSIVAALFVYLVPTEVLRYYWGLQNRWPDAPALTYFWTSVPPVASLLLFGLLVGQVGNLRRVGNPPCSPAPSTTRRAG